MIIKDSKNILFDTTKCYGSIICFGIVEPNIIRKEETRKMFQDQLDMQIPRWYQRFVIFKEPFKSNIDNCWYMAWKYIPERKGEWSE